MTSAPDLHNFTIERHADPYVYLHTDGWYYFTATCPEYDRIELRRARTLDALPAAEAKVIWRKHISGDMSWHIWAPELHYIDGVWYIYFAAGMAKDIWHIRPYALSCRTENPIEGDWHEEGIINAGDAFSLDMTTFECKGKRYMVWAYKTDEEIGSCLAFASAKSPTELADDMFILSRPEYDWEMRGFKVNEGPAVIIRGGKVIITFSASDTGPSYCMGMLWADEDADLCDPASWHKCPEPIFETDVTRTIYGPGHNSFTTIDGRDVLIYHARTYPGIVTADPLEDPNRQAFAAWVNYDKNGLPVFEI